jgi:hypothetical protein
MIFLGIDRKGRAFIVVLFLETSFGVKNLDTSRRVGRISITQQFSRAA